MTFPSEEQVARIRAEYPEGTRVALVFMDDPQAPPAGTKGKVAMVDDAGTIRIDWENGSGLGAVPGVDIIAKVAP